MKLPLAIFIALILMVSFTNSYAQTPKSNIAIYLQIKVENSDGALVSYLETDRVTINDYASLKALLDLNTPVLHKKMVMVGGQKYELIKATSSLVASYPTIVSENFISGSNENSKSVIAEHDGFPIEKGDKLTHYWTILRPAS